MKDNKGKIITMHGKKYQEVTDDDLPKVPEILKNISEEDGKELINLFGELLEKKLTEFCDDFINKLYKNEYDATQFTKEINEPKTLEIGGIKGQPEPENKTERKIFGFNLD